MNTTTNAGSLVQPGHYHVQCRAVAEHHYDVVVTPGAVQEAICGACGADAEWSASPCEQGLRTYNWRIGARNAGGGVDSTGETGTVEAASADDAAMFVAGDYQGDWEGHVVLVSSPDMGETAELDL